MPAHPTSDELVLEAVRLVKLHGTVTEASRISGIPCTTLRNRISKSHAVAETPSVPVADALPDPDLPIEVIVAHRKSAFERRHAHHIAKRWRKYQVPTPES